jgi:hypothetical protein
MPEYASALGKREIDAAFLTGFEADVAAAKKVAGSLTGKTAEKEGDTDHEEDCKKALVSTLKNVQKAAKQKALRTEDDTWLKKYVVGDKFYSSRKLLTDTAEAFIGTALGDKLPGIDQAAVGAIQTALKDYEKAQTGQLDAEGNKTTTYVQLEAAIEDIARRRREIQVAADAIWSPEEKTNAGIRKKFKIPATKAFK